MSAVSKSVGKPITKNARFRSKRSPEWRRAPEVQQYIRHVGEILHAWNQAHGALYMVFSVLAFDDDIRSAEAIWHSFQSDSAQRSMLDRLAKARFPEENSYRSAITWAISALNEIARYRNDAAHSEILDHNPDLVSGFSTKDASIDRMLKTPLAKNWRKVRGDLYAIKHYLEYTYWGLWNEFPRPLSHRPKLQFARTTSAQSQQQRSLAKKAARERQRKSSPR